jgi:NAD(P)-dependent dehydrogenase (short-subunit alcohol dehydrogenase family)
VNVLISDPASKLGRALAAAFEKNGAVLTDRDVDVLVNVSDPNPDYRAAFEADFFRSLELMQAVLPGMIARRSGLIINVCSNNPAHASKFALEGLSRSARIELHRHGVRIEIVREPVGADAIVAMTA